MTDCSSGRLSFPACRGRRVEAGFDGGRVTGNGGALLSGQADRRLGLTAAVARRLGDSRRRGKPRRDLGLQTAAGRDRAAVFVSTTARRQVNDRLKGGTARINNGLSFGQDDGNESTAVADYSVTFAELLARFDPGGERR